MQVARLCKHFNGATPLLRITFSSSGPIVGRIGSKGPATFVVRSLQQDAKFARRRRVTGTGAAVPSTLPIDIGRAALAGGAVFGVGALCYYGLGLAKKEGAIDHAMIWPEYVRTRIRETYMYFGSSLAITAGAAAATFRSPLLMNLVSKNSFLALAGSFALLIGTQTLCRSVPYEPGVGLKQLTWLLHSATLGAFVAPLCVLGGPLLIRAAWYTAGVVGGLSAVACCAPSDRFLYMGGPLAMGLGVVVASSIGSVFLPATGVLGASLYSISMYGGLLVMSGFVLYDTQRIIKKAEIHNESYEGRYDPINMSIGIYLDTINIFIRIAMLMAGGGGGKQKR